MKQGRRRTDTPPPGYRRRHACDQPITQILKMAKVGPRFAADRPRSLRSHPTITTDLPEQLGPAKYFFWIFRTPDRETIVAHLLFSWRCGRVAARAADSLRPLYLSCSATFEFSARKYPVDCSTTLDERRRTIISMCGWGTPQTDGLDRRGTRAGGSETKIVRYSQILLS